MPLFCARLLLGSAHLLSSVGAIDPLINLSARKRQKHQCFFRKMKNYAFMTFVMTKQIETELPNTKKLAVEITRTKCFKINFHFCKVSNYSTSRNSIVENFFYPQL